MHILSPADAGRAAILLAVTMQAIGKVAYGTFLTSVPSPLFVFVSFTLTASLFLFVSRRGAGELAWGVLSVLNVATAVTFLSFFFALKLIEPAIAVAMNICIGPVLAVLIAWRAAGVRPTRHRIAVCAGILTGCAVLCVAALRGSGFGAGGAQALLGLGASALAGIGAVAITVSSKTLMERGWQPGAVLAHRFYVVVPASLALSLLAGTGDLAWTGGLSLSLVAVTVVGVMLPLYFLQYGIRRCEPYTVMVTMTALPVLTFLIEGVSPSYQWSWPTAAGLAIVTFFLLLDVARGKREAG